MRADQTFTAEALRLEAMSRRMGDPDVVGTIWRWDHLDLLTEAEAKHWDLNMLPFGWFIRGDSRSSRALDRPLVDALTPGSPGVVQKGERT